MSLLETFSLEMAVADGDFDGDVGVRIEGVIEVVSNERERVEG